MLELVLISQKHNTTTRDLGKNYNDQYFGRNSFLTCSVEVTWNKIYIIFPLVYKISFK